MNKTHFLTTPLYYVNAKPHIGHAYTNVLTDAFARFYRLKGESVFFLTGTGEHGTKIEKIARDQGKSPREFVDLMVPEFKSLWKLLGIDYDYFIRTTDEKHKLIVGRILQHLEKTGDIYKATYEGWYCTPCESFWTELQLSEGKCPDCHREVQKLSEDNYFFKLAKYQEWLVDYIQKHDSFILPTMRRNEILGFLKQPLEDLCITRPRARLQWGIDYPNSKDHVVYVWFDALINYISAVGFMEQDEQFKKLWPAEVHFVGKDILRQHAVYWPIMLKALGLEMPKTVLAHGWWTMSGAKMSKSVGNIVDPIQLSAKYGTDAFRYYMLREVTLGLDGAFSEDLFYERYSSDLANDLGNLWFRFASMLEKYFQKALPEWKTSYQEDALIKEVFGLWNPVNVSMEAFDPREALSLIFAVIKKANQYVEENKPWSLAKDPAKKEDLQRVMVVLAETLAHVSWMLQVFVPVTAGKILDKLGVNVSDNAKISKSYAQPLLQSAHIIERGEILFPKLEEDEKKTAGKK